MWDPVSEENGVVELIGFAGTNEGQQSMAKPKRIFANGTCRGSLSFLTFLSLVLFHFFFFRGRRVWFHTWEA